MVSIPHLYVLVFSIKACRSIVCDSWRTPAVAMNVVVTGLTADTVAGTARGERKMDKFVTGGNVIWKEK